MYFKLGTWVKNSTFFVAANNLLKADCQRGANLVQVRYSVYGGLVKCGGRVVSHLAGR
ncbi:hypothetical protein L1D14_16905 [Vibrio tubiashii]|uniref:hypothetical protein n=1 Tax=Vibrio tubiashii TaxID=29498 RepID=UPI001EFD13B6|nr:hypothetical protein [Vibrio tubiashii]MCG9577894.1 hypothetical protein [Vibrio tubiashii]